jgi:glycosyltransferase involved in cell wall biosynthesis
MQIILATYNYFPHYWGGSEIYVHGLAKHLQQQGFEVIVIAGIEEKYLPKYESFYKDDYLSAVRYEYEGVPVIGCSNQVTTKEIYARYNPVWKKTWLALLKRYWGTQPPALLLHLHAVSPLVNQSLIEAARDVFPHVKTVYSYHVPESCPKGTLNYFNQVRCEVRPSVSTCTACILNDRLGIAPGLAKTLAAVMPPIPLPAKAPSLLQIKHLIGTTLNSYDDFARQVDLWLVMSHQIEQTLMRLGISQKNITVIRHGIDERYFEAPSTVHRPPSTVSRPPSTVHRPPSTVFVYVGRFKKVKGIHTMLEAWLRLPEIKERQLLLIGGDHDIDKEVTAAWEKAKRRSDVQWLGVQPVEKIRDTLRQSHCLIVPSEWVEIGPLVLHEAIASGANVIASDIGGCAELAAFYGDTCQTFRMADAADLAEKIERFQYRPVQKKVRSQSEHYALVLDEYRRVAPSMVEWAV